MSTAIKSIAQKTACFLLFSALASAQTYDSTSSTFAASSRVQSGGKASSDGNGPNWIWLTPDGVIQFKANATSIDVRGYQAATEQWNLYQDGVQVGSTWTSDGSNAPASHTMASGLSGSHLYTLEGGGTTYSITLTGGTGLTGVKPPLLPFIHACGDSITFYQNIVDWRNGDWWPVGQAIGASDQHIGFSGLSVSSYVGNGNAGTLRDLCATVPNLGSLSLNPQVMVLTGGANDALHGVPIGNSTTPATFQGDSVTMLMNAANSPGAPTPFPNPPSVGIFYRKIFKLQPTDPDTGGPRDTYGSAQQAAMAYYNAHSPPVPGCYYNTDYWLGGSPDYQSGGVHPSIAGYVKIQNLEIPIFAGAINGQSYTITGPSTATLGSPITLTITLAGSAQFVASPVQTIAISDNGKGGAFSSSFGGGTGTATLTPTTGGFFTVTYTPAASGAISITTTAGQDCWTPPASHSVLVSSGAPAGYSLLPSSQYIINSSIPNTATNRLEVCMHDWNNGISGNLIEGFGWQLHVTPFGLNIANNWDTGPGVLSASFIISTLPTQSVCFRLQHDDVNKLETIEAWDSSGTRLPGSQIGTYTACTCTGTGLIVNDGAPDGALAFVRVHSTLVGPNARAPVTVEDANRLVEWKFDQTLLDASGNGWNASLSTGTASYVPTLYRNVVSVIRTPSPPVWTNIVTQRAGTPVTLDGTGSINPADNTSTVTCFWQQLTGPTIAQFDSHTSCTPTLTGLIFGDYLFQLTATAAGGSTGLVSTTSTSTAHVGVVAMDNNGVVVDADPNVDLIFGPMIAFGKNPWTWFDAVAYCGLLMKSKSGTITESSFCAGPSPNYDAQEGFVPGGPVWLKRGTGTISYIYSAGLNPQTTLNGAIGPTTNPIVVTDASKLDLTSLPGTPVILLIGDPSSTGQYEYINICSVSGNNLTPCYDGRSGVGAMVAPTTWSSGAPVGEYKVAGTGTHFLTDPTTPICPVGAGTPPGTVVTTGTAHLSPGSADITGITGAAWTSANAKAASDSAGFTFVASATHGSVPFFFSASINVLTDGTHITLSRPYPSDADNTTFSYSILKPILMVLHNDRTTVLDPAFYGTDGLQARTTAGCSSETLAFTGPWYDSILNSTVQTGVKYGSAPDAFGSAGNDPQFYATGLGHRAMWRRSGLDLARDGARNVDYWMKNGAIDGGILGPIAFKAGGGILSAIACVATDPGCPLVWTDVRYIARSGYANLGTYPCDYDDSRDLGYAGATEALMLLLDPTPPNTQGIGNDWLYNIQQQYISDLACKTPDGATSGVTFNSWAGAGARESTFEGPFNFTAGSATATVSGPVTGCDVTANGTATATGGSGALTLLTGSLPTGTQSNMIVLTGTQGGGASPFVMFLYYSVSGSTITASGEWGGDSGTVNWMYSSSTRMPVIGANSLDPNLIDAWACKVSGTTLTLNRPWQPHSGSGNCTGCFVGTGLGANGIVQQPFMLSLRGRKYGWLSLLDPSRGAAYSTVASNYHTLTNLAGTWQHDYGYDPNVSQGFNYYRVAAPCEPMATPTPGTNYSTTQPGCNSGLGSNGIMAARELSAENMGLASVFYRLNPSPANKLYGDTVYGSLYGNKDPSYPNTGGVYTNPVFDATQLTLYNIDHFSSGKYYGFHFGVGMNHQWPAVRLGGVAPIDNRVVAIGFTLSITNAAKARVTITYPSGASPIPTVCTASPCVLTLDRRAGSPIYKVDILNSSDAVIAPGDSLVLNVLQ